MNLKRSIQVAAGWRCAVLVSFRPWAAGRPRSSSPTPAVCLRISSLLVGASSVAARLSRRRRALSGETPQRREFTI